MPSDRELVALAIGLVILAGIVSFQIGRGTKESKDTAEQAERKTNATLDCLANSLDPRRCIKVEAARAGEDGPPGRQGERGIEGQPVLEVRVGNQARRGSTARAAGVAHRAPPASPVVPGIPVKREQG